MERFRSNKSKKVRFNNYAVSPDFFIKKGFYFGNPIKDKKPSPFDIISAIEEKISSYKIKIKDVDEISEIVKSMQTLKLYQLVGEVRENLLLSIEDSSQLLILLNNLAEKYRALNIWSTFLWASRCVREDIDLGKVSVHAVKRIFTSFLVRHFEKVERLGWELTFTKQLPLGLELHPFEVYL